MVFELPPLPYDYSALEPYIDTQTMHVHHDKHHAAYVNNLNTAVQNTAFDSMSVYELVRQLNRLPDNIRTTVRNNAGGHANHTLFWQIMKPNGGGQPTDELASAIERSFGSFDQFRTTFNDAGAKLFGSGWVWLVLDPVDKLLVTTTTNQDSPLMNGLYPVMGNDVWEHAYYLEYQNRRLDYLVAWWNIVNWDEIARLYAHWVNEKRNM
jgi:Fe-Mn family superoxide dismutase